MVNAFGDKIAINNAFKEEFQSFLQTIMIENVSVTMVCRDLLKRLLHAKVLDRLSECEKATTVCVPKVIKEVMVSVMMGQFPEESKVSLSEKLSKTIKRLKSDLATNKRRRVVRQEKWKTIQ